MQEYLEKLLESIFGRPVEGWSYKKIQETFGEIKYYVHDQVGVPLIVADDDISGTFWVFPCDCRLWFSGRYFCKRIWQDMAELYYRK